MKKKTLWTLYVVVVGCFFAGCGGEDGSGELELGDEAQDETAAAVVPAAACTATKVAEVLAPASSAAQEAYLACSLTLPNSGQRITKRLVMQGSGASGVTLDCQGSVIHNTFGGTSVIVRSRKLVNGTWSRPDGVTIRNCRIEGSVRVTGLGVNGEAAEVLASSHSTGHTLRAQNAAPIRVTLDHVVIVGSGTIPLYLSPGVTYARLLDSEITGRSASVGIYMDAESGHNTIKGNYIHVTTDSREQLAVDGSASNTIMQNDFAGLNHGGIYLYRNCGEGGTVRHQTPQLNDIYANFFYYESYTGSNPAVWLASRNGLRTYCEADAGYPFGSSISNLDYARYNIVADNQIRKRSVSDMLKVSATPNFLSYNRTVTEEAPVTLGCPLHLPGGRGAYLRHGDTYVARMAGSLTLGTLYRCSNNVLTKTTNLPLESVSFGCGVSGNSSGCSGTVACPAQKRFVGLRGACNLESEGLGSTAVSDTAYDLLRVVTKSDFTLDGRCSVGSVSTQEGSADMAGLLGFSGSATFGCKEFDFNGGDCLIRGQALCL